MVVAVWGLSQRFGDSNHKFSVSFGLVRGWQAMLYRRARAALQMIGKCKTKLLRPADIKDDDGLRAVYEEYERQLREMSAVDFSDFARLSIEILNVEPSVLDLVTSRHKYVLVDEFQDTSRIQFQLLKLLGRHGRVTAVGDDWQSIYSFQGADIQNFDNFTSHFSEGGGTASAAAATSSAEGGSAPVAAAATSSSALATVKLEQNFRSTSTVVAVSNAVIAKAEHGRGTNKQVYTLASAGPKACVVACRNDNCELEFVLADIEARHQKDGTPYAKMAILFRTNKIGQEFQDSCVKRDLPFMCKGTQFYKTGEIRDILSLLSVVVNDKDDLAVLRSMHALRAKGKIEQTVVDEIRLFCKGTRTPLLAALQKILAQFEVVEKAAKADNADTATPKKARKGKAKKSGTGKGAKRGSKGGKKKAKESDRLSSCFEPEDLPPSLSEIPGTTPPPRGIIIITTTTTTTIVTPPHTHIFPFPRHHHYHHHYDYHHHHHRHNKITPPRSLSLSH
jgi:superfamily I DNA/RNA helicase